MTDNEKAASIDYILRRGLVRPQNCLVQACELFYSLGLRYIFWDTSYSLIFTAVTMAGVTLLPALVSPELRHTAAVGCAPLLFLLIMLFAETTERADGLYELKQTCRYTVAQITALRVMGYSALGVLCSALVTVLSLRSAEGFVSLFMLCLAAMFLCAAVELLILRRTKGKWTLAVFSAVWVFLNLAVPFALGRRWELFLSAVPTAASAAAAMLCAAGLAFQIRRMLTGGRSYAAA